MGEVHLTACFLLERLRFSGSISLNAAVLTAVLLGSRLRTNEEVFVFVLLAIEVLGIFPMFQREIKVCGCGYGGRLQVAMAPVDDLAVAAVDDSKRPA